MPRPFNLLTIFRLLTLLLCHLLISVVLSRDFASTVFQSDNSHRSQLVFSVKQETTEGVVGAKVVLGCRVKYDQKYLETGGRPYLIVWYKQKRILTFNSKRVTDDSRLSIATASLHEDTWDLQIDPVQLDDEGEYDCIINTKPPTKKTVRLIVKVPPRINFNQWKGERVLKEGTTYQVSCSAKGKPPPNVTWYRERKNQPRQKIGQFDFQSEVYVQGSTLKFVRINRTMEGSYLCVAQNGVFPDAKKWIIIIVQFPPQVRMVNTKLGQRKGELTILQCRVWGNPVGKMSWKFNGIDIRKIPACHQHMEREKLCEDITKPFEDSRRISVDLTIRNISASDYGTYTCVSRSVMGVGEASTHLHELYDERMKLPRYRLKKPWVPEKYEVDRPLSVKRERQDGYVTRTEATTYSDENEVLIKDSWGKILKSQKAPKSSAPKSSNFPLLSSSLLIILMVNYFHRIVDAILQHR